MTLQQLQTKPKDTKVVIDTTEDLCNIAHDLHLKPAAKAHQIVIGLLNKKAASGTEEVDLFINCQLIAESYQTVPAMFARLISPHVEFLSVQCYLEVNHFHIRAANSRKPTTFRSRALHALTSRRRFVVLRSKVPKTYRKRPNLFAQSIVEEIGEPIAVIAKKKKIIWKLTSKTE